MVDQAKRKTLKNVVGIGVGVVATATSVGAFAQLDNSVTTDALSLNDLADIQVSSRISSQTNELEVVLTNVGSGRANITDMTPAEIKTARGRFDFNALFSDGSVELAAGESVTVPMQHHPVVLDGSAIGQRVASLSDALRQNVSIVTDGDSLAAVHFESALNVA